MLGTNGTETTQTTTYSGDYSSLNTAENTIPAAICGIPE